MKTNHLIPHASAGLVLAAVMGFFGPLKAAEDSLIAMGTVDASTPAFLNSTNTVGGVLSLVDNGAGNIDIVIDAVGAFAGSAAGDFLVEITKLDFDTDNYAYGIATNVTDDQLTITTRGVDLEGIADPDDSDDSDTPFSFVIRRMPAAGSIGSGTSFLLGLGGVDNTGDLTTGFGVNGVTVHAAEAGIGIFEVTFTKTGAFSDDFTTDYVALAQVRGSLLDDELIGVSNIDVSSDDNVVVRFLINDVQESIAGSAGTPTNDDFFFSVYRIPADPTNDSPASALLVAGANVNGSGSLQKGSTSLPGGVVTATDTADGTYEVDVVAAGAFAGKFSSQYVVVATIADALKRDKLVQALASIVNDSTLRITVKTVDVEVDGNATGIATDESFSLLLYDAAPTFQPDLHIGQKRNLTTMKGDDVFNTNGAGQRIKVNLPLFGAGRFHFAVENNGASMDNFLVREKGAGSFVRTKYFRLTGGRTNVTAKVRTGKEIASEVAPDGAVIFQAQPKFRSPETARTRNLKLTGTSDVEASTDTVKAKVVPSNG
ncbi:MAG: hypothetical protein KDN18_13930 [Verrucomicrobiae bacterium]|nr:hypothetical protein [Verrucomicrobiae bacterium]